MLRFLRRLIPAVLLAGLIAAPAHADQVTVGTYNVKNYKLAKGESPSHGWTDARRAQVMQTFTNLNADIVSFQEATKLPNGTLPATQIAQQVKPAGRSYRLATGGAFRIGTLYDANKMTKLQGPFYVPFAKEANDATKTNIAAVTQFRHKSGKVFWFVSMHLSNDNGVRPSSTATSEDWRKAEAKAIVQTARAKAAGQPIVYAGDFNTYAGRKLKGGAQSRADASGRFMRSLGYAETGIANGGPFTCNTKCSGIQYDSWHNWAGVRTGIKRMDRVFVTRNWAGVTGWRLVREGPASTASDHFPVKVFLQL